MRTILTISCLALLLSCTQSAAQTGSTLPAAETLQLQAEGDTFSILRQPPRSATARGSVLLLHDQGTSADSHEVIRPLRLGLAEAGWETLSLQLPQAYRREARAGWLARETPIRARLDAALGWLRARGTGVHVVLAYRDSGTIAVRHAAADSSGELSALVLVSAQLDSGDGGLDALQRLSLPVLDVQAERDPPALRDNAAQRARAADVGGNRDYRQRSVPGAGRGFRGLEMGLLHTIRAWLAGIAAAA